MREVVVLRLSIEVLGALNRAMRRLSVAQERLAFRQGGASLVEYVLLVALIAVVCITTIGFLGTTISRRFSQVGSSLSPTGP